MPNVLLIPVLVHSQNVAQETGYKESWDFPVGGQSKRRRQILSREVAARCGVAQLSAAVLGLDGNPDAGRARYGEAARFAVAGPFGGAVNSVGELILGRLGWGFVCNASASMVENISAPCAFRWLPSLKSSVLSRNTSGWAQVPRSTNSTSG